MKKRITTRSSSNTTQQTYFQSAGSTLREGLAAQTEEKEDKKLSLDLKSKAGRLRDKLFSGFRMVWCAEASGGGTMNA